MEPLYNNHYRRSRRLRLVVVVRQALSAVPRHVVYSLTELQRCLSRYFPSWMRKHYGGMDERVVMIVVAVAVAAFDFSVMI